MNAPPAEWVLYDASCGFCARWVPWWTPTFARVGLATAALQEPWVAARTGLAGKALLRDLVILLTDGRLVLGAGPPTRPRRRPGGDLRHPLGAALTGPPQSLFVAEGSAVTVGVPQRLA